MLDEDRRAFFRFLRSQIDVFASTWTSHDEEIITMKTPELSSETLALWTGNSGFAPNRKSVKGEDQSTAFVFEWDSEAIEYEPSRIVLRGGVAALLQGRLYNMPAKSMGPQPLLLKLAKGWLRRSCESCPFKEFRGYIGPFALKWFQAGGLLLPMFNPPFTPAWEGLLSRQHSESDRS
jgi:hypothetical protein